MLKIEIKSILLGILVSLNSCDFSKHNVEKANTYVKNNFNKYNDIYKVLNDSINIYIDSSLATFLTEYYEEWQVDSLLCINNEGNRLFGTINASLGANKNAWSDDVMELLGKKINGKWYFFKGGGTLAVPRNMYRKDEMHPLTFHELSQIARKEMLESALVKKNGEYVVSDEWIDKHFYQNGYGVYNTRAAYDSIHWMLIMRKWKEKIDTNEYKPVRRNKPLP